jgi:hypothetical protein
VLSTKCCWHFQKITSDDLTVAHCCQCRRSEAQRTTVLYDSYYMRMLVLLARHETACTQGLLQGAMTEVYSKVAVTNPFPLLTMGRCCCQASRQALLYLSWFEG